MFSAIPITTIDTRFFGNPWVDAIRSFCVVIAALVCGFVGIYLMRREQKRR
jgi:hypothetical protein